MSVFPIAMGSFWFTVLELALASFKITCQGFVSVNIWRSEFDMFMFAGTFWNVVSKWSSTLVGSIAVFASELWKRNAENFSTKALVVKNVLFAIWWCTLALWQTKAEVTRWLTFTDTCWCLLTLTDIYWHFLTLSVTFWHLLTSTDTY